MDAKGKHVNGWSDFAIAYHPDCPHCRKIVKDVEQLGQFIADKKMPVNLVVINMSKTMDFVDDLKIEGFPSLKLYKTDGTMTEYHKKPVFDNFVKFLKDNGI